MARKLFLDQSSISIKLIAVLVAINLVFNNDNNFMLIIPNKKINIIPLSLNLSPHVYPAIQIDD